MNNGDEDTPEQDASKAEAGPGEKKRGRGRPSKGPPVPVRLDPAEREFADLLGRGNAAEGVRVALNAVKHMEIDAVRALSKLPTAAPISPIAMASATRPMIPVDSPLPIINDTLDLPPLPKPSSPSTDRSHKEPKGAGSQSLRQ